MEKIRQSNIELLRIVCMLMILALHINFYALGSPRVYELDTNALGGVTRSFLEFVCIIAVNVFVLISGWFGIRVKKVGLLKFLFQIIFFYAGIYLIFVCLGQRTLNFEGFKECIFAQKTGWFIKAYLGLYILSPVLNTFVEKVDKKQLRMLLIAFFIYQTIYGWYFSKSTSFITNGYSTFSFIGLYLLARYLRLYGQEHKYFTLKRSRDMIIFLSICVLETMLLVLSLYAPWPHLTPILWAYSSPLVIVSALYLLLYFSKLDFKNKFINNVAVSSFSVYLLHSSPCIMPYYVSLAKNSYFQHSYMEWLLLMILQILVFYIAATLIDRLRILLWNIVEKQLIKHD